jgi:predicted ribosomally synthesized peptide with nif11-like leader
MVFFHKFAVLMLRLSARPTSVLDGCEAKSARKAGREPVTGAAWYLSLRIGLQHSGQEKEHCTMSIETVRAFYDKVAADEDLQAKVKALDKTAERSKTEAMAALVGIAAEAGFIFTAEDFAQASDRRNLPERVVALAEKAGHCDGLISGCGVGCGGLGVWYVGCFSSEDRLQGDCNLWT